MYIIEFEFNLELEETRLASCVLGQRCLNCKVTQLFIDMYLTILSLSDLNNFENLDKRHLLL